MKHIVFISHSSEDKAIAEEACRFLEENGISCWIAPRDVTPGKNYGAAIVDAIDECSVFVLILSHDSNKSGQVAREVERAASNNDVIIPFRVEDVQPSRNLEFYVSSAHWLDASTKPLSKHLDQLVKAIKDWQQNDLAPKEPAAAVSAEAAPLPPAPPPLPSVATRRSLVPFALAAIIFAVILGSVVAYKVLRRTGPQSPAIAQKESPIPAPTLAPAPTAALDLETETPTVVPSEVLSAPTAIPTVSLPTIAPEAIATAPSTTSPLHRRPGEPFRSPIPEATFSPSVALSPMKLRPGQPLAPVAGSTTASPSPVATQPDKMKPTKSPLPTTAPAIREVAASSQLNAEEPTYRPTLAFDGNRSTAWVTNNDGVGQSISVHFKTPATISAVSILNSVATNETQYQRSNRVHTVRMTLSDGTSQLLTFEDKLKAQRFELQTPAVADWVKFDIVSVFRGKKSDHTAIAEIAFNRDVSKAAPESAKPRPRESPPRRSPIPKSPY
jgi:hypothetical protein